MTKDEVEKLVQDVLAELTDRVLYTYTCAISTYQDVLAIQEKLTKLEQDVQRIHSYPVSGPNPQV